MKTVVASLFAFALLCLHPSSGLAGDKTDGTIRIEVPDMVCEGCASTITKALKKLEGVSDAHVDPKVKVALIKPKAKADLSDATLKKAVEDAGYEVGKIERIETAFAQAKKDLEGQSS
ncbi:MAG: heavy-metal-associated domain-containing protein [Verrucomicrobiae bacterium]|nr:heavy-metal-associated domain-containing protein [Verrucomicrobiae bacterium]MCB1089901.1 heavy-metal-associated domain-containing protein [Verrucomicrobiae bacterium]